MWGLARILLLPIKCAGGRSGILITTWKESWFSFRIKYFQTSVSQSLLWFSGLTVKYASPWQLALLPTYIINTDELHSQSVFSVTWLKNILPNLMNQSWKRCMVADPCISAAAFVGSSCVPPQVAVCIVFLYSILVSTNVGKVWARWCQSCCSCENLTSENIG